MLWRFYLNHYSFGFYYHIQLMEFTNEKFMSLTKREKLDAQVKNLGTA